MVHRQQDVLILCLRDFPGNMQFISILFIYLLISFGFSYFLLKIAL